MATKIVPTVGRVVWFHPRSNSSNPAFAPSATCAAIVARVIDDAWLNLAVFDGNGAVHATENVPLIQDGDEAPEGGFYAEWMPYQKGQAAREQQPASDAPSKKDS